MVKIESRLDCLMYIIQQMDEMMASLMENLLIDINRKMSLPRGHHGSFSTRKRAKILQDLRNWNDDFKNLVEKAEVPADDNSFVVDKVKLRYNRNSCVSIRESLQSLHRAVQSGMNCDTEASHQATIELDWFGRDGSPARPFAVCLLHGPDSTPATPWRRFYAAGRAPKASSNGSLTSLLFTPPPPRSTRSPSPTKLISLSVTVEEESPSPALVLSNPSITDLCAEFQRPTTAVKSFGSLKDPTLIDGERFFSLSHVPSDSPEIVDAIPLKTILVGEVEQEPPSFLPLSAKQRYAMAASLAQAVLYLSDSPWLCDGWDKDQVKVFLEQNLSGHRSVSENPYLSCHFAGSPPASLSRVPEDILRRSIPNKIIFALGILLIELAVNEAFHESSFDAILEGDYLALRRKLDKVYREAGCLYGNAAQRCVNCEFLGHTSQIDFSLPRFRQQFHHTVIAPLQATYEVFSTLHGAA
ncbi:hypothetical protein EDB81DRAFT_849432 [Dactylonectria macrodidyma]|uniref:DUF7580 domain-containing protein n=1 Tax=Dactylonectria macrodidyma TaxID=307937 RepID=A0A9P9CXM9_9HYPO|nr:hypothetical protein EDB81DRAFT_849432 [Dactylonectria macrodidyma]